MSDPLKNPQAQHNLNLVTLLGNRGPVFQFQGCPIREDNKAPQSVFIIESSDEVCYALTTAT